MNLLDSDWIVPYLLAQKRELKSYKELSGDEQQDIQQVLFIMDKFCIVEAAYHELTCCPGGEELPRSYLVKQCKDNLNKLCYIDALNFYDALSTVIEKMESVAEIIVDSEDGLGEKLTFVSGYYNHF
ncbi:Hypothetical predicted protein [Paramuricea clavata]|uniref:Uncharacterized protein n=1 Tax=Paramuricea clavata TaxID=317549 RepID=A0A6S7HQC3_PARCT|nr:Hypothetical predicted protein [Paramuricea clavata]